MTSHEILKADLLDILFDNRNKQYGAYVLRRQYNSRLAMALGIALSTILFLFFFLEPGGTDGNYAPGEKADIHLIEIPPIRPKIPVPPVKPTPPAPAKVAQSSLTRNLNMVQNPDPEKALKPVEEIRLTAISSNNVPGSLAQEIQSVPQLLPTNSAGLNENKEEDRSGFVPLEKGPEFPGGQQAWANFLNRYLRTPEDLEPGEKKMVLISFFVDADGSVTGFKVVRSGGNVFDNEVIRVLKKMPKWKPAIQNGQPVAVPFTQPVTFVGLEQ